MFKIGVSDVRHSKKGMTLALCNIELKSDDEMESFLVIDARVMRSEKGELWVGFPERSRKNNDGSIDYTPAMHFPPELRKRISKAVLEAYNQSVVCTPDETRKDSQFVNHQPMQGVISNDVIQ